MNATTNTPVDIDSFLDQSLDDIADLPSFAPFPIGAHIVTVNFETKQIGTHPAVEINMVLVQTSELADPTATPMEPGATSSVAYMLDNQYGVGNLKKIIAPIAVHLGFSPDQKGVVRAVIENCKDLQCMIVSGQRKGKEEGQVYMDINSLQVV